MKLIINFFFSIRYSADKYDKMMALPFSIILSDPVLYVHFVPFSLTPYIWYQF